MAFAGVRPEIVERISSEGSKFVLSFLQDTPLPSILRSVHKAYSEGVGKIKELLLRKGVLHFLRSKFTTLVLEPLNYLKN